MKKTFPVNINGKVFYIDEDAYELLLNYLDQLKSAFSGSEGEEIVSDIESRISELFDERISQGANAIVYSDVNDVIEIMGKPSDISGDEIEEPKETIAEDEFSTDNSPKGNAGPATEEPQTKPATKKLYRSENDKILGGVFGGIGAYFGWDSNLINIIRILYGVLTACTMVWPLSVLYLLAWMVIPPANNPRRILEQKGEPITVDNISKTVLSISQPPLYIGNVVNKTSSILTNIIRFIGKCFMGLVGLAGAATTIIAIGFFLFFLVSLISYFVFDSTTLLCQYNHFGGYRHDYLMGAIIDNIACMSFAACFMLPGIALAWGAMKVLFNCKGVSRSTIIFSILLEIILVVTTIVLVIYTQSF